jgi:hypothetical protein
VTFLTVRRLLETLVIALGVYAGGTSVQAQLRLQALTVPPEHLPKGCALAPVPTSPNGEKLVFASPNLRTNPWVGTDRSKAAIIREVVDGPPRNTDPPPGPAGFAKEAENVIESYRAVYVGADASRIDVYAVRFDDPKWTGRALMSRVVEGVQRRIIVHETLAVAVLPGEGGDCFRAVVDYIASVR